MQTRTFITGLSRRQPAKEQRQRPRKGQKPGRQQVKVSSQQQSTSQGKAIPMRPEANRPLNNANAAKARPGVIVPATIKPSPKAHKQIPPLKPSNVKVKTLGMRKQAPLKKIGSSRKTRLKPMARTILYALRLLIVGVGIGAIVGTVLSILDPATRTSTQGTSNNPRQMQTQPNPTPTAAVAGLSLSQEITPLKTAIQSLVASNPNLTPGVFVVDLDNGSYVDVSASSSFPAASTIKIPILVAFFQDVDSGKIRLDESLTMQKEMVVGGSGDMQFKPVGTQFTALEVATKMMTISDNTATNMLITRMGGIEALNQRFRSWGLTTTTIRNPLPDLQGTNTTSPKELGNLMAMVNQGNLVGMISRDRILDIMRKTVRNHLLPTGLGQGATIAHKTGDIGTVLADAGLVDLPTNKRYIVAVMVKRPNNDPRAEKLISSISRAAYQQLTQVTPMPTTGYQSPVMAPGVTPTSTLPPNTYQPPVLNPSLPNNMGSTMPPLNNNYQSPPMMTPQQYYYPYQR
ncbi:serine hydrolase [Chlorogloeopsis sp. ULAP01]|uniref:serine hydrolase n=1 Tax=Chlorogloeopsis sp. ULAP01 TaxID=3056483 RepID=UPI0025AAA17D|nr:serine hydrolase [Chlorogloeopsis sp. ULAP01]MDM9384820.1 serine hydrolase [Chlorogloeopsis sp. ULAP01]